MNRFLKEPVLHLPDDRGLLQLYSDTSHTVEGRGLYQIQLGKPKLIAYASE